MPLLIGRDAHRIEDTWQYLYRGAYWRRGPVTMAAIAAVDTALWDIKAKVGGPAAVPAARRPQPRGCPRPTATPPVPTLPELFDSISEHLELGYRAIRIQTGIPGLAVGLRCRLEQRTRQPARTAEATHRYDYEPARRTAVPVEETWDTRAYLRHIPSVFEAVRTEFGPELPLLHDAHHRLTPIQAAKLGKSLEPYDLFWLEDVTPAENQAALRRVREHTTTPLAIGEVFNTIWDYRELFEEQLIDYVRIAGHPRRRHHGAAPHLRLRRRSTRSSRASTGPPTSRRSGWPRRCTWASPSRTSASRSTCGTAPRPHEVFRPSYSFEDGMLLPGEEPGLGVEYDDERRGGLPLRGRVPAGEPAPRRVDARLVNDGQRPGW